ncbi:MAG: urease accessory protein UreE [Xanthobacteraceae bacterium]|nr:urease accessory protein UreE [Xanthobacteraceae bacterium]
MRRGIAIKPVGAWGAAEAIDRVVLGADDRQRRRIVLTGENGTTFLLDLERPTSLRNGDGLVLDDGAIIEVLGAPEPLIEVIGRSATDMVRFAWHIGNRHAELQIVGDHLRIRSDHVLEAMLAQMGATLTSIDAPFDPEI